MPKIISTDTALGTAIHEWRITEYERYDRSNRWYIVISVIGVVLVLYGLWDSNFLFSLIIMLAAIILFLWSHQEPTAVVFQITTTGIVVGNRLYPYNELENFYIVYEPPEVKMLFISPKSTFRPTLRIPLDDQNPLQIRQTLRQFLAEDIDKEEEPASETAARRWKLR